MADGRLYGIGADLVLVVHLLFILFVCLGGFLLLKWRWLIWLHIPAAVWGALIEFAGWICPLTPLENDLRRAGGEAGYSGGFVEHYIVPLIYPSDLTRQLQIALGIGVLLVNAVAYGLLIRRVREEQQHRMRENGGGPG